MISVIIVNFNVSKHLFNCLDSLENSNKNKLLEVIVIDNNSSEDIDITSKLIAYSLSVKFYKLNYNRGFASAVNYGIQKSSGNHILLLNPDTLIRDNTILNMSAHLNDYSDVGIVGCKVLHPNGDYQYSSRRHFPLMRFAFWRILMLDKIFYKSKIFGLYNYTFHSINQYLEVDAVSGACMMFRKELISDVGLFDERFFLYFEDTDFCYRVKRKWKIVYNPDCVVTHLKRESFKNSHKSINYEFFKSFYYFYMKYFDEYRIYYIFKLLIKNILKIVVCVLSLLSNNTKK